tara:strand:- start:1450 stop:2583 length:1134 start_codon:yes stop_codon:yes gene_type:complete
MIKNIPKSAVWKKSFPVYKKFTATKADYEVISGSLEVGDFDTGSFNKQGTIFTHPLLKSITSKYYHPDTNPFTLFGEVPDIGRIENYRVTGSTAYVISIDQSKFGERIKNNSLTLKDPTNSIDFTDDGVGNIVSAVPLYKLNLIDFETGDITIQDADNEIFTGSFLSIDFDTGVSTMTFGDDTDQVSVGILDLTNSSITTATPMDFDGLEIDEARYGNIFYSDGTIILWDNPIDNYTMGYRSTKTIHETEVLVSVKAGEFNYSQNPSAVDVTLFDTPEFHEVTRTGVHSRDSKVKIKQVLDITRKNEFYGSVGTSTGSWDDYDTYRQTDPTGSYLAPFITTIALYDEDGDMVAIAKLPTPIKNLPDMDMNFIIRFDT